MSPISVLILALYAWLLSDHSLSCTNPPYDRKGDTKLILAVGTILCGLNCVIHLIFWINVESIPFFLALMGMLTLVFLLFFWARPHLDSALDAFVAKCQTSMRS